MITPTQAKALYNLATRHAGLRRRECREAVRPLCRRWHCGCRRADLGEGHSGLGTTAGAVIGSRHRLNLGGADGSGVRIVPVGGDVIWTGASNTTWSNTANWNPSSTPNGVNVTFDDSATGTTTVNINAADVTPTSVTFNNSVQDLHGHRHQGHRRSHQRDEARLGHGDHGQRQHLRRRDHPGRRQAGPPRHREGYGPGAHQRRRADQERQQTRPGLQRRSHTRQERSTA